MRHLHPAWRRTSLPSTGLPNYWRTSKRTSSSNSRRLREANSSRWRPPSVLGQVRSVNISHYLIDKSGCCPGFQESGEPSMSGFISFLAGSTAKATTAATATSQQGPNQEQALSAALGRAKLPGGSSNHHHTFKKGQPAAFREVYPSNSINNKNCNETTAAKHKSLCEHLYLNSFNKQNASLV